MAIIPIFLDISGGEFLIIFLAIFLVFGPKKVPEIARQVGKIMNELKKATSDLTREFQEGADEVRREVGSVKSNLLEETQKIKAQLTNVSSEASQQASQIASTINRESQIDISGRNQAAVFQQPIETPLPETPQENIQKAEEEEIKPIT